MLTIKSGKKGPQIKKGIIDTIIKLIKTVFEYFKLFIKIFKLKFILNYLVLIFITLFFHLLTIEGDFKPFLKFNFSS